MYGHTAYLAAAVAEGARSVSDTEVVVKRVPELMPAKEAEKGGAVVDPGTGGGNETTITSFHTTLFHHGMIVVGLPYNAKGLTNLSEVRGGSPLGAGTIAGADGTRQPSEMELELARFQGRHVATVCAEVMAGRQSLAVQIPGEEVIRSVQ
jgi:multimeric flavodoxin WrbA